MTVATPRYMPGPKGLGGGGGGGGEGKGSNRNLRSPPRGNAPNLSAARCRSPIRPTPARSHRSQLLQNVVAPCGQAQTPTPRAH